MNRDWLYVNPNPFLLIKNVQGYGFNGNAMVFPSATDDNVR